MSSQLDLDSISVRAAAELELRRRREALRRSLTFVDFVRKVKPRYQWYRHCQVLASVLQRVADGELKRVMVFMPPRHGKSELTTRLFPAYFLNKFPEKFVGINSYASDLAYTFSRSIRDNFWEIGGRTRDDSYAVKHWNTTDGGGCWAAGVGGPITGKGFDCFPAGTQVLTESGLTAIETLYQLQDPLKVLSLNHETGELEWRRIIAANARPRSDFVEITLRSRDMLRCTPEHLIFSPEIGYKSAQSFAPGQTVVQVGGAQKSARHWQVNTVSSVRELRTEGELVYDIQVEGNSNFFANGILVHNCGIIDDPLKNAQEAFSNTIRQGQKDWWASTFSTREEPDGAIVIILTRWHEDDLAGWLLKQELGEDPEGWHIVNFPAIYEESPVVFPGTCTIENDWRQVGEALCPERYPLSKLRKFQKNPYFWSALYQQRPSPLEGDHFKRGWWKFWSKFPRDFVFDRVILSWDCAFKETKKSDFVVGQVWGQKGADFYLLDQVRGRMDINGTITAIRTLSAKFPTATAKLIEDKANGPAVIDLLNREIPGLIPIEPEGGKLVRAVAVSPYVQSGNVFLPDPNIAPWVHDYIEEFSLFPNGANDDQVDATTQAINWLVSGNAGGYWGTSETVWGY